MKLREMCLEIDVELAFLPHYSPNYNPVETSFAILKKWMKKYDYVIAKSYGPLPEDFERFLHDAMLAQGQRGVRASYFALRAMTMMIYRVIYRGLVS